MEVERGSDLDWGMVVLWREYFEDLLNLAEIASVEEAETGDQLRGGRTSVLDTPWEVFWACPL